MKNYEKLGLLYLGRHVDPASRRVEKVPLLVKNRSLTTHGVIIGMTGSGKTGLGVALIEEAIMDSVPSIVIDPKGDMANLLLSFPENRPEDFAAWVDPAEAERHNQSVEQYGAQLARTWREGLEEWDQDLSRISAMRSKTEMAVYTPGSSGGAPVSLLSSFEAPGEEILGDLDGLNSFVASTTSSLLALVEVDGDPLQSREHILLSSILLHFWRKGENLDMEQLIGAIVAPPFARVGVFPLNTWYPQNERMGLAMKLNNLLASPSFAGWTQGTELDLDTLLHTESGMPRTCIFSIAHLSEGERMFFVTTLLNRFLSWMRRQPGTANLKALLYMDEVFGYFPPVATPPSKKPMLLLLKQARGFGVGVVLATQNPADLDYRGLSNIGTWFVGRLQTERDREKVLDGLGDRLRGKEELLASMKPRQFLFSSVHGEQPQLFATRWVMSYLKGPISLEDLKQLVKNQGQVRGPGLVEKPLPESASAPVAKDSGRGAGGSSEPPVLGQKIEQLFLLHDLVEDEVLLKPLLVAEASVRYFNQKRNIDEVETVGLAIRLSPELQRIDWKDGSPAGFELGSCFSRAPEGCRFADVGHLLQESGDLKPFAKSFSEYLYQTRRLELFRLKGEKLESRVGESRQSFRTRCLDYLRERQAAAEERIRRRYSAKQKNLERRLERTLARRDKEEADVKAKTADSIISVGVAVLGAFFGRRSISSGTIGRAATAVRGVGRISREKEDVRRLEEEVEQVRRDIEELLEEIELAVETESMRWSSERLEIERFSIAPRRRDIFDLHLAVVWAAGNAD